MAKSVKKPGAAPKAAAKPQKSAPTNSTKTTSAAKKSVVSANGAGSSIAHDQVARLAHRYFEERGRKHGHHEEDWFRAEQELRAKAS
jgi:Protein of unknown function (DUF2934)